MSNIETLNKIRGYFPKSEFPGELSNAGAGVRDYVDELLKNGGVISSDERNTLSSIVTTAIACMADHDGRAGELQELVAPVLEQLEVTD